MSLPRLVSFSGYAFAGKDAAADTLVQHNGYVKTYMSKPLEQALLTLDPWIADYEARTIERYSTIHAMMGYDESKKNPEVRRLLQVLGTEVGRKTFGENAWLDPVIWEIHNLWRDDKSVVLTGVRFQNELDRVHTSGGYSIWVNRPGVEPVNSHSSDNTLKPKDCMAVIDNDGTINDLYFKVREVLAGIRKPRSFTGPIGTINSVTEDDKGVYVEYSLDEEI